MVRLVKLLLGLCTALFTIFISANSQDTDFKISTDVLLVLLDVGVKDPRGGYVSGLTKDAFQVYENGVLQKLTVFSSADVPVTAGLVIDNSGSMKPKRGDVVTAGLAFAGGSNPKDEIFIVNFNDRVWPGLPNGTPFTDDIDLLRSALLSGQPEGRTALYDGIAFALRHLDSGKRDKKTLVVVSDGGDNHSTHNLNDTMRLIQESHATIYTVGIFDPEDPDRNPGILKRIAAVSGGECFLPEKNDEIVSICKKIATDIRKRYTIGYIPSASGAGLRKIRVTATAPNRGKLVVRTRASYSLPQRPARP